MQPYMTVDPGQKINRTSLKSIGLVVLCTIIGAAAQFLLRYGTKTALDDSLVGILLNWSVLGGYFCLAINTVLLVLALRNGQLSVLYPIIALTYVWVTLLSPTLFGEIMNIYKTVGVGLISVGVCFIGLGCRS